MTDITFTFVVDGWLAVAIFVLLVMAFINAMLDTILTFLKWRLEKLNRK